MNQLSLKQKKSGNRAYDSVLLPCTEIGTLKVITSFQSKALIMMQDQSVSKAAARIKV